MEYVIYFIITIGILVFVHEFGHFAAAKICKMRVDVFALGMGKRLFGWNKLTGFVWGDLPKDFDGQGHTDYRVALLPLGGYVKIAGMVDESFDTKFANEEPKPYEFRAKPTYQKIFVITAGVMMNLLLTVTIFWGINFYQGKQIIKTTEIGAVQDTSLAAKVGFKTHDKVIAVDNKKVKNWQDMNLAFVENLGKDIKVKIERKGKDTSLSLPSSLISKKVITSGSFLPISYTRPLIEEVMKDSPAETAGIKAGDIFLKINNIPIKNSAQLIKIISSSKDKDLSILTLRGKDTVAISVNPGISGKIGVGIRDIYTGPIEKAEYGFWGSLTQSVANIGRYTMLTFSMVGNIINGDVEFSSAFGGPVKIAKYAAQSADAGIITFLFFLAMLSLSLAIINILPFPALDGGHFVIILIEGIMGKELPVKAKIAIQNFGFVILLLLMVFIIYSDIISL